MAPIPKRSDQRLGHRDHTAGISKAQAGPLIDPGPADEYWADIAKETWEALKISGQSQFFEATDWAYARYICEAMSRNLHQGGHMSAVMMANVQSGLGDLLATEGHRRRVKVELQRGPTENADRTRALASVEKIKRGVRQPDAS